MSTQPTYVPMPPGYPLVLLQPGDRYLRAGALVEVVERVWPEQIRVRSVANGRVHTRPADTSRVLVDSAQLLADRPRPEALTMNVWAGGSSIFTTKRIPIDVDLTRDGTVWLRPVFYARGSVHLPFVTRVLGLSAPNPAAESFQALHAVTPVGNSNGVLALLTPAARAAWGTREWDRLALRMRMLRDLCGGLTLAGEMLLSIGECHTPVDSLGAWIAAISSDLPTDLTVDQKRILAALADRWTGTAAQLVETAQHVTAPACA